MGFGAPEDVVNAALIEAGQTRRIADIYEGGLAAVALQIYGQTRDELLRSRDWPFNRRTAALALLKGPPPPGGYNPNQPWTSAFPPRGWLYEYAFPADCLKLGGLFPAPGLMFELDPHPALFRIDNDNAFVPAQKVVLANLPSALAVYRAQVTDPATWEAGFAETLVKALAAKLAKALLQGQIAAATAKENIAEAAAAMMADSRSG